MPVRHPSMRFRITFRAFFQKTTLALIFCLAAGYGFVRGADPAPETNPVGQQLIEMFTTGFGRGPNPQKESRRHYESALELSKNDSRVEYGFGLVLLKQLKNKEALAQFQLATKGSGPEFLPAWQALIWMHLVSKDSTSGFERMREFARRLANPKSRLDEAERERSAEWIGQVLAALQKSMDTLKQREALLREDEALQEILGPDLTSSLARGKVTVHSLHALLEGDVQQARELAEAKEQRERADREAQVAKDLEASAEKRETLKKNAEESKKYLDEQLAAFDKQLTRLERDYEFLQKRVLSITASQVQLNAELGLLSNQATASAPRNNAGAQQLAQAYEQRKAVLEFQSIRYQVDLDQTLTNTMLVSQKAQAIVGQRMAAVRQYERSTGQIVQQDAALDKWQDRLKKDGEKLKAAPKVKAAPVASKIEKARSFRTYVELDLVHERDRLLDSFGVAMSDKSGK